MPSSLFFVLIAFVGLLQLQRHGRHFVQGNALLARIGSTAIKNAPKMINALTGLPIGGGNKNGGAQQQQQQQPQGMGMGGMQQPQGMGMGGMQQPQGMGMGGMQQPQGMGMGGMQQPQGMGMGGMQQPQGMDGMQQPQSQYGGGVASGLKNMANSAMNAFGGSGGANGQQPQGEGLWKNVANTAMNMAGLRGQGNGQSNGNEHAGGGGGRGGGQWKPNTKTMLKQKPATIMTTNSMKKREEMEEEEAVAGQEEIGEQKEATITAEKGRKGEEEPIMRTKMIIMKEEEEEEEERPSNGRRKSGTHRQKSRRNNQKSGRKKTDQKRKEEDIYKDDEQQQDEGDWDDEDYAEDDGRERRKTKPTRSKKKTKTTSTKTHHKKTSTEQHKKTSTEQHKKKPKSSRSTEQTADTEPARTSARRTTAKRRKTKQDAEGDEDCFDVDPQDCKQKQFLCGDHDYEHKMHVNCPVTCKTCNVGDRRPTYTERFDDHGGGPCEDQAPADCTKNANWCNVASYSDFMAQHCPVTCGQCLFCVIAITVRPTNAMGIYYFVTAFLLLVSAKGLNGYTFNCLDGCECDTDDEAIHCHNRPDRLRVQLPPIRLRGFTVLALTRNNIEVLPSEEVLLEKLPDLKAVDVEGNDNFDCSTLDHYSKLAVMSDCGKSAAELEADRTKLPSDTQPTEVLGIDLMYLNRFHQKDCDLKCVADKRSRELREYVKHLWEMVKQKISRLAKKHGLDKVVDDVGSFFNDVGERISNIKLKK
uniref:ShKT domain-containing protein n=1 Tax=Globodera pallida TaxID=36090 RepID=A0A183C9H2_GLOPA